MQMLHDPRRLEISQSPSGSQTYFLEYGSLWPLTTDIFAAFLTERGNGGVTKICAVTAIWFSEGQSIWEQRLHSFLNTEVASFIK